MSEPAFFLPHPRIIGGHPRYCTAGGRVRTEKAIHRTLHHSFRHSNLSEQLSHFVLFPSYFPKQSEFISFQLRSAFLKLRVFGLVCSHLILPCIFVSIPILPFLRFVNNRYTCKMVVHNILPHLFGIAQALDTFIFNHLLWVHLFLTINPITAIAERNPHTNPAANPFRISHSPSPNIFNHLLQTSRIF